MDSLTLATSVHFPAEAYMLESSTCVPVLSWADPVNILAAWEAKFSFLWVLHAAKKAPQTTWLGSIGMLFMRSRASVNSPARPSRSTMHP
ncbi:hypothetical protein LguiB_026050 [Lonicera macranthoides]